MIYNLFYQQDYALAINDNDLEMSESENAITHYLCYVDFYHIFLGNKFLKYK